MADNTKFVQINRLNLSGSGVTNTATSITLTSLKFPNGTTNVTMTDFGDIGYGVHEPGTTKMENFSFTGITQNAGGTAILTGVIRGLRFNSPYTQDTALRQAHAGGTIVVISNSAPFYNELSGKDNDETITGIWTYTTPNFPQMNDSTAPTTDNQLATKKYADDLAIAGAPDSTATVKGLVETATSAESQAGTDSGGTSAPLFALPSDIAVNVQNAQHIFSTSTDDFVAAFLTGDTGAQSTPATWAAVSDGSFRITVDGTARNVDAIDFTGDATMDDVAATIQAALRTATSALETVVWSTDHFIISSVNAISTSSSITVTDTSTGTVGTDISGAGGSDWMDADTANGVVTAAVMTEYTLALTPVLTVYAIPTLIVFNASNHNLGSMTVDVNGLGSKTIKKNHDQNLEDNDIETGSFVVILYDGTNAQLVGQQASMPTTAILNEMATFFGATDMTAAEAETLTDGSDATSLHVHAIPIPKTGQALRAINSTGNQEVTHNLGVTPRLITIHAMTEPDTNEGSISIGTATSTSNETCTSFGTTGSGDKFAGQNATHIIDLTNSAGVTDASATLSAISTTTFTINWDVNANTGSSRFFQWIVQ